MAGQQPTLKSDAPALATAYMTPPMFTPTGQVTVLGVCERKIVVDGFACRYSAAVGSACTGKISHVPSGTAYNGTNVDATGTVDLNTTVNTVAYANGLSTGNVVPAGSLLLFETSAAVGSLAGVSLSIRYSTVVH